VGLGDLFSGRNSTRLGRSGAFGVGTHASRKLRDRDETGQPVALSDEQVGPLGLLYCGLLVAVATFILDFGAMPPAIRERTAPSTLAARVDFQYNDPYEATKQRDDAARKAPRVYNEVPGWVEEKLKDLTDLIGIVEVSKSLNDARDRSARYPAEALLVDELYKYNESAGRRRNFLSTILLDRVRASLLKIAEEGIVSDEDLVWERNKPGEIREIIRMLPPGTPRKTDAGTRVRVETLNNISGASDRAKRASWSENLPPMLERHLASHLQTRMSSNLTLDLNATHLQEDRARDMVGSGDVKVRKGDVIVAKGNPVGRSEMERLHEEYVAWKASQPLDVRIRHVAGLGTFSLAVLMLFVFIISRVHHGIFRRRRALGMLGLFFLTALAATKALMLAGYSLALAPYIFIGIVASLAFGQIMSLLTLAALTLLSVVAGVRWESVPVEVPLPALALAMMLGGIAAALPPEQLRDRRDLLRYAVIGGVAQFVLSLGMSQLGGQWYFSILSSAGATPVAFGIPTVHEAVLALINGPLCGLLVLGALPVIEWLFGILTNIRLFELADMNQPALKRIQLEAPGTFAHTLQVRNLADPAADVIGANMRLVSAGVLYHDLGKTLKPEYFVENQMNAEERHRRLRPSVSALLITAHVKDGIELAHEYGLPLQIVDFIAEHHGTTLVSYFYHSARKDAESMGDASGAAGGTEPVQEAFFRYPGPKPQSRETAIVMLADTIEAATRTLVNPSAARLQAFVHELIMDKMLDGQLDECDLTFAELALIEDAFLRVLVTRFHSRIKYPGQEEAGSPAAAEMRPATTIIQNATTAITPETLPNPTPIPAAAPGRGAGGKA